MPGSISTSAGAGRGRGHDIDIDHDVKFPDRNDTIQFPRSKLENKLTSHLPNARDAGQMYGAMGASAPVPACVPAVAHDNARRCAYVLTLIGSLAWGVYAVPSTFFLEQVGEMSSAMAASTSM